VVETHHEATHTIFWASTLVEQQTGVLLRDATLVISMFFAGMVIARSALSLPASGRREPILIIRAGIAVLVVGSVIVWATTSFPISLIGFLAMGSAQASSFPLGIALTLDTAPLQPQLASSRLALASGLGILVMPLVLGVVADASSVSAGMAPRAIPVSYRPGADGAGRPGSTDRGGDGPHELDRRRLGSAELTALRSGLGLRRPDRIADADVAPATTPLRHRVDRPTGSLTSAALIP
jgi:hypothetical protein